METYNHNDHDKRYPVFGPADHAADVTYTIVITPRTYCNYQFGALI